MVFTYPMTEGCIWSCYGKTPDLFLHPCLSCPEFNPAFCRLFQSVLCFPARHRQRLLSHSVLRDEQTKSFSCKTIIGCLSQQNLCAGILHIPCDLPRKPAKLRCPHRQIAEDLHSPSSINPRTPGLRCCNIFLSQPRFLMDINTVHIIPFLLPRLYHHAHVSMHLQPDA